MISDPNIFRDLSKISRLLTEASGMKAFAVLVILFATHAVDAKEAHAKKYPLPSLRQTTES